jgi:hypothetical protein
MRAILKVALARADASLTARAHHGNFDVAHRRNSAWNRTRAQAAVIQLEIRDEGSGE